MKRMCQKKSGSQALELTKSMVMGQFPQADSLALALDRRGVRPGPTT